MSKNNCYPNWKMASPLTNYVPIKLNTVESRFTDLQLNDIPGITINICFPGKSYSKMYGAEPWFNDIPFNDIPGLTMGILFPREQNLSRYNDKINMTDHRKCCFYNKTKFN